MVTFLHTSDWQLGMTRWFFKDDGADAQTRFTQDRIDAIGRIGQVAQDIGAEFIVVAGDVFDSNTLPERVVRRALDAMEALPVPVYLLPGNHDALEAGSIYHRPEFEKYQEKGIFVLRDSEPVAVRSGVEIVGAPLRSKVIYENPANEVLENLTAADGVQRVLVAHGQVQSFGADAEATIDLEAADRAIDAGKVHYIAVGDKHSTEQLDSRGFMWFSGSHETTDFDHVEKDSGNVLEVRIDESAPVGTPPTVVPHKVGTWKFHCSQRDCASVHDVEDWLDSLQAIANKPRVAVKYSLTGTVSLSEMVSIERRREGLAQSFAAFYQRGSGTDLTVVPDDGDIEAFGLTGFPMAAARQLKDRSTSEALSAQDRQTAADALGMLARLAKEA